MLSSRRCWVVTASSWDNGADDARVMAKNCNVKCPAGLTTNAEAFEGDPRALAQYLINVAHEVRDILAALGLKSLREARGRTDLLQLLAHQNQVGQIDMHRMLAVLPERPIAEPVYLEANFSVDDALLEEIPRRCWTRPDRHRGRLHAPARTATRPPVASLPSMSSASCSTR